MKTQMNIKQKLYKHCQEFVTNKLQLIEKNIQSNKESLNSETKSSAGDKHETGRAMLQLEMEKAGQQLKVVQQMQTQISRIDVNIKNTIGCLGSLITTNIHNYYLAVSVGKVTIDSEDYFVISSYSPIGKLLLGKKKGDSVSFNNLEINIENIA